MLPEISGKMVLSSSSLHLISRTLHHNPGGSLKLVSCVSSLPASWNNEDLHKANIQDKSQARKCTLFSKWISQHQQFSGQFVS